MLVADGAGPPSVGAYLKPMDQKPMTDNMAGIDVMEAIEVFNV